MKRNIVVTLDLGGTNLRLGAVNSEGEVLLRARAKMGSYRTKADLLERLSASIKEFLPGARASGRVRAVCLGFAGYTNSARGLIYFAPNVGGLRNIGVGPYLKKSLRMPVFVENDANCAALGEYWRGAGRGAASLFMFTLGTGVGGGFIIDGKIWRGASGAAGEIGHTIVMAGGPRCSCGNRGCLEAFASATAIVREYRRRKKKAGGKITARQVIGARGRGDRAAAAAVKYAAKGLGLGIANVFNLLSPSSFSSAAGSAGRGPFCSSRPSKRRRKLCSRRWPPDSR